jgi:hypothetical protein
MSEKVIAKTTVGTMIALEDQTQWTFPTPDVDGSASWKLRYTNWEPSRTERLMLASILDSYTDLIYSRTQKKILNTVKGIKRGMHESNSS